MTLFATHYHELTVLSERLPRLRNAHVAVREWGQDIVFVHRLQPGPTSRSHGIAVARLAGLPTAVVARARDLLDHFEAGQRVEMDKPRRQLGLFADTAPALDPRVGELVRQVAEHEADDLTPRQAHTLVAQWAEMVRHWPEALQRQLGLEPEEIATRLGKR